jgi:hypothetical protein
MRLLGLYLQACTHSSVSHLTPPVCMTSKMSFAPASLHSDASPADPHSDLCRMLIAADKLAILSCVLELDESEDAVRSLVTELVGS